MCSAVRATSARPLLLAHEPRENAGAAFRGLVEQEAVAHVTRRHRLGEHLAFL